MVGTYKGALNDTAASAFTDTDTAAGSGDDKIQLVGSKVVEHYIFLLRLCIIVLWCLIKDPCIRERLRESEEEVTMNVLLVASLHFCWIIRNGSFTWNFEMNYKQPWT